jgi:hypothetical protein
MKNTQVIQLMSIVRLSIFMLGITMMSCNSKKEQQLPAIGKSVIIFLIKEMMISIFPILCQVKTISIILFCRDGILILVFVQMEKVIIF